MGLVKRQMEEDWDRGWHSAGDKSVCEAHLGDDALRAIVAADASETRCSYCERSGDAPFAVPIDLIIERVATSLPYEWRNADDEGVAWDEGEYVGETFNSWDLLEKLDAFNDGELLRDVATALPEHSWAQRDFYRLRPDERLIFGWESFGEVVKHRRRYFFADHRPYAHEHDDDYIAPAAMLSAIGEALLESGLIRRLASRTPVFRVRAHNADEHPRYAAELGATPAGRTLSSARMSPAGVPLFYGALDEDTAIIEAHHANPRAEAFTLARFELCQSIDAVDLAEPTDVPSLLDEEQRHLRAPKRFLRHFANAVSEPFERDDRIHIEYVPTQVVTEWLRTRFDLGGGHSPHGILYRSARKPGGTNVAFFIDNDGAVDPEDEYSDEPALLVLRGSRRL
jgi:RES domain-containing protein